MLLNKAELILKEAKINEYSNSFFVDEINKVYKTNCATFIKFLLEKLEVYIDSKRACEMFYEFDEKLKQVLSFKDVRPGDIICWKKEVIPSSGDSGHIAIVKEVRGDYLRVIDCVKEPHAHDTRCSSGIGEGDIKLIFKSDEVAGFIWSDTRKKTKFTEIKFFRI